MSAAVVEAIEQEIANIEEQLEPLQEKLGHYRQLRDAATLVTNGGQPVVEQAPAAPPALPAGKAEAKKKPAAKPADKAPGVPQERERRTPKEIEGEVLEYLRKVGAGSVTSLSEATGIKDYNLRSACHRLQSDGTIVVLRKEGRTQIFALTSTAEAAGARPVEDDDVDPDGDGVGDGAPIVRSPISPPAPMASPPLPQQQPIDALKADVLKHVRKLGPISAYVIHGKFNDPPHKINAALEELYEEGKIYRDNVKRWVVEDDA